VGKADEHDRDGSSNVFHGAATMSHRSGRVNQVGTNGVTIVTMATPGGLDRIAPITPGYIVTSTVTAMIRSASSLEVRS
jgi:hypothetical protein